MSSAAPTPPVFTIRPPRRLELDAAELWAYRDLLYFLIWRDLKVRYKQTIIGGAWAVVQPLLTLAIFVVVFGRLARIPSDGIPYPLFFYPAILIWTYFAGAVTHASQSMVEHQQIITKTYFPRVLLPAAGVLSGLADFAISFVVLVVLVVGYGVPLRWQLIFVPVFLLMAIVTAFAVGLWLSALNARYRDVRYALPFLVQIWMFSSPVAYGAKLVPERWQTLYGINPMAGVIEGFRWAVAGSGSPPDLMIGVSLGVLVVVLVGGIVYFQRTAVIVADVV